MASREKVFSLERCLASGRRFGYDPSMSTKERAIAAIDSLPEDSDMADILREIAFITGTDQARKEIARGEGMDASEAKAKLREWTTR
tara:strand:+ start:337 stop:597 length:261 start_codon:yes stop_codon:yes gene_type:complete